MKFPFFALILIFCSLHKNGVTQAITLKGLVKDSLSGKAIPDAIITLKKDNQIIASAYSGNDGMFSLQTNPRDGTDFLISCRHVAYIGINQNIILKKVDLTFTFLLPPKKTSLEPVEVKSNWKVQQNEDTIKYNPNAYKTATTRTVSDLLGNIPGFKVLPDGKILFQNKSITALLIDGDDIMDEQYGAINKNLDARAVSEIEVFSNYEKNKVLASLRKSGKLAVNLKITDEFKGKLSGNLEVGAGLPDRGILHPSMVYFTKKSKQFYIGNANNISQNIKGDLFKYSGGNASGNIFSLEEAATNLLANPSISNYDLPETFTINNQTAVVSTLGLIKLPNKKEITYRIGYEYDLQKNNESGETDYFIDSTQNWQISNSTSVKKLSHQGSFRLKYRHKNTATYAGEFYLDGVWYRPTFSVESFIGGILTDTTLQKGKHKRIMIQSGYESALKTKALGVIQLKGNFSYQNNPSSDLLRTNRFNPLFQYTNSEASLLYQQFQFNEKALFLSAGNFAKNTKIPIEYGIQFSGKQQEHQQNLLFTPLNVASDSQTIRDTKTILYQLSSGYFDVKFLKNKKHKLYFNGNIGVEGIDISRFSKTILQYAFKGQYEWTLTRYISLQSNGSISRKLPDINWFGPDTVLQSAQKIVQASQTIEPAYNIDFSTNLTYRKLTGNTWSFQYSFNQSKGDYGWMPTLEPGYNSSFAAPLDIFRQNSFNLEFRRFIYPLKGTIHLLANINLSSSDLLVNLMPVTNRIKIYQTEVKWVSSFAGKLNFEIGGKGSTMVIDQKSDGTNLRSDIQQAIFLFKSIYQPNSKTHTGIEIKSLYYENAQSWAGQFFAERKLSKSISLQIQWHNMFFANQLRFQYNTPNSKGFSSFRLVPSYLLGKVIWYL